MPKNKLLAWVRSYRQGTRPVHDAIAQQADAALGGVAVADEEPEAAAPVAAPVPEYGQYFMRSTMATARDAAGMHVRVLRTFQEIGQTGRTMVAEGSLPEDVVGGVEGTRWLTYSRISSCLGLLVVCDDRLVGVHLTVGTQEAWVDGFIGRMTELAQGHPFLAVYTFGPSTQWAKLGDWAALGKDAKKVWRKLGIPGALASLKQKLPFDGKINYLDQDDKAITSYRVQLRPDHPGTVLVERKLTAAPDTAFTLVPETEFRKT